MYAFDAEKRRGERLSEREEKWTEMEMRERERESEKVTTIAVIKSFLITVAYDLMLLSMYLTATRSRFVVYPKIIFLFELDFKPSFINDSHNYCFRCWFLSSATPRHHVDIIPIKMTAKISVGVETRRDEHETDKDNLRLNVRKKPSFKKRKKKNEEKERKK